MDLRHRRYWVGDQYIIEFEDVLNRKPYNMDEIDIFEDICDSCHSSGMSLANTIRLLEKNLTKQ